MPHGPTYARKRKLYADVVAHEDDEVHWGPGLFPVPHAARFCTAAAWQRCFVHFLRNALDHLPRKAGDNCLQELRWHNVRRDLAEARQNLAHWLAKWQAKHPKLCDRLEENMHVKSTDVFDKSAVAWIFGLNWARSESPFRGAPGAARRSRGRNRGLESRPRRGRHREVDHVLRGERHRRDRT